jgi:hypothetical protein
MDNIDRNISNVLNSNKNENVSGGRNEVEDDDTSKEYEEGSVQNADDDKSQSTQQSKGKTKKRKQSTGDEESKIISDFKENADKMNTEFVDSEEKELKSSQQSESRLEKKKKKKSQITAQEYENITNMLALYLKGLVSILHDCLVSTINLHFTIFRKENQVMKMVHYGVIQLNGIYNRFENFYSF